MSPALLLALLAGPALAQGTTGGINYGDGGDKRWWDPNGVSNCQSNAPIAGTAGYRNAAAAITTNATTYGAAQWAERNLFPLVHRRDRPQKATGASAMETNLVFTATRVPSVESGYPFGDCPYDYRVTMRALDLGASNFGFAVKKGRLGMFYAGSLTWSSSAFANNAARGMMTGSYLMWGGVGAAAAPAMGGWEYDQGVSTISPDWILGATVDATVLFAEAGYVGSSGFYGHVQEGTVGFFGSALVQKGVQGLPFFKAGADRMESKAGLSSVYARKLPLQAMPRYGDGSGAPQRDGDTEIEDSLQTAHIEQLNLGGIADVLVAGAWKPEPALFEAQVGLHSKGYHEARKAQDDEEQEVGLLGQARPGYLIRGGVVNLPDLWYYGVEGGIYGTARVEGTMALAEGSPVYLQLRLLWNDPEMLALYPFAYNGVWISYRLWAAF